MALPATRLRRFKRSKRAETKGYRIVLKTQEHPERHALLSSKHPQPEPRLSLCHKSLRSFLGQRGGWSWPFVSGGQRVSTHILPHTYVPVGTWPHEVHTVPCGLWCSVHNSLCPLRPPCWHLKSISSLQIDCNLNSPPSPCLSRSRSRLGAELSSCLSISRMGEHV